VNDDAGGFSVAPPALILQLRCRSLKSLRRLKSGKLETAMSYFSRILKRFLAIPVALIGTIYLSAALFSIPVTLEEAAE